jgi:AcrR family transcriptional regulator
MTSADISAEPSTQLQTPKRADARRNYEKLLVAARDSFAEAGPDASLEEIARRAGVGIGTLYRHFPTRQALLEAAYVEEVEDLSRTAAVLAEQLTPWEALAAWLRRYVGYTATKRALIEELSASIAAENSVLQLCKTAIFAAGEPLLERAQAAGVVRQDTTFIDVVRMVSGIAAIPAEPAQIERILEVALDGLRRQPA